MIIKIGKIKKYKYKNNCIINVGIIKKINLPEDSFFILKTIIGIY
jgi:hypothetical protein